MWKKSGINIGKCGQRGCMTGCGEDRNMIRYQGQKDCESTKYGTI